MSDVNQAAILAARFDDLTRRMAESREENNRRFDGMNNHMERQFQTVHAEIQRLNFVPRGEYDLFKTDATRRLDLLEERSTTAARTLVAALVLPILVLIIWALIAGSLNP